jgi:hypothetical protein
VLLLVVLVVVDFWIALRVGAKLNRVESIETDCGCCSCCGCSFGVERMLSVLLLLLMVVVVNERFGVLIVVAVGVVGDVKTVLQRLLSCCF